VRAPQQEAQGPVRVQQASPLPPLLLALQVQQQEGPVWLVLLLRAFSQAPSLPAWRRAHHRTRRTDRPWWTEQTGYDVCDLRC
jgi:hypothetical protein